MFHKAVALLITVFVGASLTVLLMPAVVSYAQAGWQQWAYLSVEYSQSKVHFGEDEEPSKIEILNTDTEPYATDLPSIAMEECADLITEDFQVLDAEDLDDLSDDEYVTYIEELQSVTGNILLFQRCMATKFKGRSYYLDLLGMDGWELIHIDNHNNLNTYKVDMIFKRPKL